MFTYQTVSAYPTAPALSDWRARCVVYSTNQGNTWHVESPDRQHNLNGNHNRWQLGQFFYHNETQARKALSLAPIYPGATPCERSDESLSSNGSPSPESPAPSTSLAASSGTSSPNPLTAAHVEKNAGDGTVDAVFVAANAGEYEAGDYPKIRYTSDGKGGVTFAYQTNGPCREWGGIDFHMRPVPTRFLPLPPKDNKCESSSGCGAESLTPSQPSRRRRCE